MNKFKVGDRVRLKIDDNPLLKKGHVGVVCDLRTDPEDSVGVAFDNFTTGHTCGGTAQQDTGWYVYPDSLEYDKVHVIKQFYDAMLASR